MKTLAALCALLLAAPATAQSPVTPVAGYGPPIGVEAALKLVRTVMENSAAKGHRMAFAVVEPSGELVAFARMDDVPYGAIALAQQKARTAARLRVSTANMEERVAAGRTALLSSDEVLAVGGGVPILVDGRVIGAIGVSGGTAAEDAAIAASALPAG